MNGLPSNKTEKNIGDSRSADSCGHRLRWGFLLALALVVVSLWGAVGSAAPKGQQLPRRSLRLPDTTAIRPTIPHANRYQRNRVFLERANELRALEGVPYQIVVGDVMFRKGGMYMYCDSAHFFDNPGMVQAFGNVRMQQGDTLFVYADELQYADSTQLAVLYADPGKKVRLINKDVTLKTDVFNYDLGIELGYYEVGGVLTDKSNRLDSRYGEYSPSSKEALFRDGVHLNSLRSNDTLDIYTEEMLYNTGTHIAILDTTSTIVSGDGTIFTSSGVYNTQSSQADLYRRSLVVAKNGNTLTGDTLYYDRNLGFGEAMGNIELTDTANKVILTGNYGFYFENADSAMVTGRALAREFSTEGDTLFLHADTIRAFRVITPIVAANNPAALAPLPTDSASQAQGGDSIAPPAPQLLPDSAAVASVALADTTHHLVGAPHVRFYRSDLQGICDSLTFVQKDSMLYLDRHPIVWNDKKQIFGNTIQVHLNDSTADWAKLPNFGFMAEWVDEEFYNQLTGKEMHALFANRSIKHLDVSGNVQAVLLPEEADSTINKIANIESSFMAADFKGQSIERLKMWPETPGTMTPLFLAKKNHFYLPQFQWFEPLRPTSPYDVLNITKEMLDLMAEPPFGTRKSGTSPSPLPVAPSSHSSAPSSPTALQPDRPSSPATLAPPSPSPIAP